MSFFIFLTVVQALVAAALVGVILIQKSEGGGLGVGGSPAGFMSARGAADFLTRATTVLATLFVGLSIVLAALAVRTTTGREMDTTLDRTVPAGPAIPADPLAPAQGLPVQGSPVQGAPVQGIPAVGPAQSRPASGSAQAVPATKPAPADPLAPATKP